MYLSEQIDLFSLPIEQWGGGNLPIRKSLYAKVRARCGDTEPDFVQLEKQYESEATKAAQQAYDAKDFERGDRILARYAEQAKKRAEEHGLKSASPARLEGDVGSLRQAVVQGKL